MSGGGAQGSASNAAAISQIDPRLYADWQGLNARAQQVAAQPYQAYGGPRVAYDNDLLGTARQRAMQSADMGQGQIGEATQRFSEAGNLSPMFINGQETGGAAQRSAAQIGDVLDVMPETIGGQNRAAYTNPYIDEVVNKSLGDIDRTRQMQTNDNAYAASQAGAFGGSRHGVVDSLTNEAAQRQAGMVGSTLRAQGYDVASGLMQSDAATRNAAMTGNADRDLSARAADAGYRQQAGLDYAGAQDAMGQFNAGQRQQAQLANQKNELDSTGLNLQGAQGLLAAGKQQQDQYLTGANAMQVAGSNVRDMQQQQYDSAYDQWAEQMGFGQKQLDILSQPFGLIPSNQQSTSNSKSKSAGASFGT